MMRILILPVIHSFCFSRLKSMYVDLPIRNEVTEVKEVNWPSQEVLTGKQLTILVTSIQTNRFYNLGYTYVKGSLFSILCFPVILISYPSF